MFQPIPHFFQVSISYAYLSGELFGNYYNSIRIGPVLIRLLFTESCAKTDLTKQEYFNLKLPVSCYNVGI